SRSRSHGGVRRGGRGGPRRAVRLDDRRGGRRRSARRRRRDVPDLGHSMTEGDISAAVKMWQDQGAVGLPWDDIERAPRRLPGSGICAVSDDAAELFMLTPTDTLFTVS